MPFLPQSRKPRKVDILKGSTEYIQVFSEVLGEAKDSEKQDPDHQNHGSNKSFAGEFSKNISQLACSIKDLKNEERPWVDCGSAFPKYEK